MDRRRFLRTLLTGVPAVALIPYLPERAYFFLSPSPVRAGSLTLAQIVAISYPMVLADIHRLKWADSVFLRELEQRALTIAP